MNEEEQPPQSQSESQSPPPLLARPLEYGRPVTSGPTGLKILGVTIVIPVGLLVGLASPLLIFAGLAGVLQSMRVSIAVFILILGGAVWGEIKLLRLRNTILNVFIATSFIGTVFALLALTACGFNLR